MCRTISAKENRRVRAFCLHPLEYTHTVWCICYFFLFTTHIPFECSKPVSPSFSSSSLPLPISLAAHSFSLSASAQWKYLLIVITKLILHISKLHRLFVKWMNEKGANATRASSRWTFLLNSRGGWRWIISLYKQITHGLSGCISHSFYLHGWPERTVEFPLALVAIYCSEWDEQHFFDASRNKYNVCDVSSGMPRHQILYSFMDRPGPVKKPFRFVLYSHLKMTLNLFLTLTKDNKR